MSRILPQLHDHHPMTAPGTASRKQDGRHRRASKAILIQRAIIDCSKIVRHVESREPRPDLHALNNIPYAKTLAYSLSCLDRIHNNMHAPSFVLSLDLLLTRM